MKWIVIILAVFMVPVFTHCTEEVKPVEFTIPQLERLLSGDEEKSWLRTGFLVDENEVFNDDCELHIIASFYLDDDDTARYVLRTNPDFCPGATDTLETGYWEILGQPGNADVAASIALIHDADTAIRNIDQITSLYLIISGVENDARVEISYETIIPE